MGTIKLISAKGVKNGKIQLCFAQEIKLPGKSTNVLGLLNASDERFNVSKPRMAWMTATPVDAAKIFGLDFEGINEGAVKEFDAEVSLPDGTPLNIQISETTEGTEYQVANFEKAAKRRGEGGAYCLHKGEYIYQNLTVVAGEAKHVILEMDPEVDSIASAVKNSLGM
jgi:hypothetical protein